jgi:hypothetical protein
MLSSKAIEIATYPGLILWTDASTCGIKGNLGDFPFSTGFQQHKLIYMCRACYEI